MISEKKKLEKCKTPFGIDNAPGERCSRHLTAAYLGVTVQGTPVLVSRPELKRAEVLYGQKMTNFSYISYYLPLWLWYFILT